MIQLGKRSHHSFFQRSESGQTLVEYVLVILLAVGVSFGMSRSMTTGLKRLWFTLGREIAAPCKNCTVPAGMENPGR